VCVCVCVCVCARARSRVCVCVTCRLTAKNRDQVRNPTLSNRVWATFTLPILDTLDIHLHGKPTVETEAINSKQGNGALQASLPAAGTPRITCTIDSFGARCNQYNAAGAL